MSNDLNARLGQAEEYIYQGINEPDGLKLEIGAALAALVTAEATLALMQMKENDYL